MPSNPQSDVSSTPLLDFARKGVLYSATTGGVGLSVVLGNFRCVLTNPSGSGKVAIVHQIVIGNSISTALAASLYPNTATVPANAGQVMNCLMGGAAATTTFKYDASGSSLAGTAQASFIIYPNTPSMPTYYKGVFVIPPGQTLGIQTVAGLTANAEFCAYFSEEPL